MIDPSLAFRSSAFDDAPSFTWADLSSTLSSSVHSPSSPSSSPRLGPSPPSPIAADEDTDLFEFVTDPAQVSAAECAKFDEVVRRCMFERSFGRSSSEASREELESLKWKEPVRAYPKLPSLASTTRPAAVKQEPLVAAASGPADPAEELEKELAQMTVHQKDDRPVQTTAAAATSPASAPSGAGQVKAIIPPADAAAPEEALSEELPVIYGGQAEIYLFDPETEYFVVQGKVRVLVIEKNDRPFDCASNLARLRQRPFVR